MKLYGEELRQSILERKARLQESIKDRMRRIDDGWTDMDDCFVSQRCEEQGISECDMQLKILDGDGMREQTVYEDENGNEVRVHGFKNQWGGYSYVANGIFASSINALLKKANLKETTKRVPVWTKFVTHGSGMCAVYTGSYQVVRWHTNMKTGEYVGYPD